MYAHSIPNIKERCLDKGYITSVEKAAEMGITPSNLMRLIREGRYQGEYIRVNSKNECVFLRGDAADHVQVNGAN
jgi:Fe2+ transport system protein FeoA